MKLSSIALRLVVEIAAVVLVAMLVNAVWDSAMSPYQAGAAAGQLADSNAEYAASRAAAQFHPLPIVFGAAFVAIVAFIVKAARKALAVTQEQDS